MCQVTMAHDDFEVVVREGGRRPVRMHPVPGEDADATQQSLQILEADMRAAVRSWDQEVCRIPAERTDLPRMSSQCMQFMSTSWRGRQ